MPEQGPRVGKLSNGIRVVCLQVPASVSHLGVTLLAGSRFEKSGEEGLAHFLEHCIFKGTKKRKAFHVLSRLDSVGGELNAYTSKEEMCVYASFTQEHFDRASELLADILLNSNFPLKEINKEKEIIIDEINSYMDSPSEKIFDDFEAYLFKGHSLGNNILGTQESVRSFGMDDLSRYVERCFTVGNMVISYVGALPLEEIIRTLEKDFEGANCAISELEYEPVNHQMHFSIRSKEANYQTHAVIGGYAPGYSHEHRRGMTLLTNILGGPALNSRLTLAIREKHGYAYNVEASYSPYVDAGYWNVYLGTDSKNLDKAIQLVYQQLALLRNKKIGILQLSRAKEQLKGHLALGMDSNSGLMLGLGKSLLLFDQIDTVQEIHDGIERLTATELLEIANTYFHPDQCSELIFELV
jgi:predicted Zn-dependent peptidase